MKSSDVKPHALHQNHNSNLKRKISRPLPHNIHAIKAYTDSDEDVSDEHDDISSEQIDSHESFEEDHDDFFDDSEEMYEDMESMEENNHNALNRHLPASERLMIRMNRHMN